jgi:hypothetical protein
VLIYPFESVDGIKFESEIIPMLKKIGKKYKEINRYSDSEKEYMIFEEIGKEKKPIMSIHGLKDRQGIQAITILCGPVLIADRQYLDLMNASRKEIRDYLFFESENNADDQTDIFPVFGLVFYYDDVSLEESPASILVASREYLSILEK